MNNEQSEVQETLIQGVNPHHFKKM